MLHESNIIQGLTATNPSMEEQGPWVSSPATLPSEPMIPEKPSVGRNQKGTTLKDQDRIQAEVEFLEAMQAYKKRSGRMFPTWSEVLEVLRDLGYQKEGIFANPSRETTSHG